MQPEIDIGPLTLQTFGIMFALAFIAAGALVARWLDERGKPVDWAYEIVFFALIGGIVGARVDYLIQNWSEVSDDLLGNVFSGTGLVWFGGAVGGALGVAIWARWRGMLNRSLLDMAAAPLALGYAIGRIGCQISGDGDYGIEWGGPWAMGYPDGTVPTAEGITVHPTPIYETIAMGLAAYVLWKLRFALRPGLVFAVYLVIAGTERFLIEFIRRNEDVALGLTQAQLFSVAMVLAGIAWLWHAHRTTGMAAAPAEAPGEKRARKPS